MTDTTAGEGVPCKITWVNDASNVNDRRMYVDGQQWAKVYGWDEASLNARCDALAAAMTRPLAAQPSAGAKGEARFQCSTCHRAANPAHFCDRHEGSPWCDECWKVGDCREVHGAGCHTLFVEDARATSVQPDTGDVAALREALGQIKDEIRFADDPDSVALNVIEGIVDAALSKPNAPGVVSMDSKADNMDAEYRQAVRDVNNMRDDGTIKRKPEDGGA